MGMDGWLRVAIYEIESWRSELLNSEPGTANPSCSTVPNVLYAKTTKLKNYKVKKKSWLLISCGCFNFNKMLFNEHSSYNFLLCTVFGISKVPVRNTNCTTSHHSIRRHLWTMELCLKTCSRKCLRSGPPWGGGGGGGGGGEGPSGPESLTPGQHAGSRLSAVIKPRAPRPWEDKPPGPPTPPCAPTFRPSS